MTVVQKGAKCYHFTMSKLLAFEEKHKKFSQYQHKGAQTWHTDCQVYQEQYEYKNSGDIGQIIGQILS